MPKFIHATTPDAPTFLAVSRGLYGEAFGSPTRQALEDAVAEWSELSDAERSFATTHLLYLAIEAQAATQSLLEDVRDALEELEISAEAVASAPPPTAEPLPEPYEDDDDEDELPPEVDDDAEVEDDDDAA